MNDDWNGLLRNIIKVAGDERDLRSLLRGVARLVVAVADADACFVHIVDNDSSEIVLMGATPDEFDALAGTIRLPIGEGIAGWVALHGLPTVVRDKWSDSRYRYIPALRGEDFSSLVSVPLLRPRAKVIGVLNVHAHREFGDEIVPPLEEVAKLVAGLVEGALLYDRLAHRELELEEFAVRTIELQEQERRRIAGDIHDGVSQRLVSAWYHLRAAVEMNSDSGVALQLNETSSLLTEALDDSRRAITGLRPTLLDDLGLSAAINSLATDMDGLEAYVDVAEIELVPHVETALFRIAQETLQNVVKHAEASKIEVTLAQRGQDIVFSVADDGVGFDPNARRKTTSFGLAGIQERAGLLGASLVVESAPGQGTRITVRVPAARARSVEEAGSLDSRNERPMSV